MTGYGNRIKRILYTIWQFTWGLPQNIAGLFLFLALTLINPRRKRLCFRCSVVSYWKCRSSMALGMFIFFGHWRGSETYARRIMIHEYGHTMQSLMLGPLFPFVIGLPSSTWARFPLFKKWRREGRYDYFDLFCEKWADYEGARVINKSADPSQGLNRRLALGIGEREKYERG
ncbi:MAG: hypothetical protein K6B40_06465 [Firmicutes bacterium]|nr:hypothetical protein [Bacillota bacterium]